ncbi:hypothetical protein Hoch_0053 [Haliangium ochraceum DSM 14365]|uniref:Uncharacterized protein n=2 Tax=Haliangium ochraceum TaxID=80816 RepID=D0LGE9_HALO1|nr:hypothetical protein Hoch_0053 [Haliangium ochraceum DSM 14365]
MRRPVVIPRRMPMRRALRISLFERQVSVRLSEAAIEILFRTASVLSEGQIDRDRHFGSTMITIDLERAGRRLAEVCDAHAAREVERLLCEDPRIHARAEHIAVAEAQRLAGRALGASQVDLRIHRSDRHLHLDIDVESVIEDMP